MKKMIASLLIVVFVGMSVAPVQAAQDPHRGGLMGFVAGCCFGLRAGMDYNDGKDLLWREWVRVVPFVGLVVAIWDGVDCMGGKNRADFAQQYGSTYY